MSAPTGNARAARAGEAAHDRFFILAVGGALLLTVLFGFLGPGLPLFSLVAPSLVMVAVMIGYRSYCLNRLGMDRHEAGDNIYYLGFLFTIASLISGLFVLGFHLRPGENAAREAIVSFLPAFGVALVTTLLGVTMRVLLTQRGGDADAYEREMRQRLQDAALELTRQADAATGQLEQLLSIMRQRAAELPEGLEAFTRSAQTSGKGLEEAAAGISRAADLASRRVREAADGLNEGAEALVEWLTEVRRSTGQAAGALGSEVRAFGATLSETARQAELREQRSLETAEKLHAALDRLSNLEPRVRVDAGPAIRALTQAVDRLNETIARERRSGGVFGRFFEWVAPIPNGTGRPRRERETPGKSA